MDPYQAGADPDSVSVDQGPASVDPYQAGAFPDSVSVD